MSTVDVRPATAADFEGVADLLRAASLPTDGLEEQFGPCYAVAECDGEIVGAEGIERYGESGLLRSAVVAPAWRGKGVGEALTRNRLAWATDAGLEEVWLLTTTAQDWFPRFGFVKADRATAPARLQASREFAEACPASAVAMRRSLS